MCVHRRAVPLCCVPVSLSLLCICLSLVSVCLWCICISLLCISMVRIYVGAPDMLFFCLNLIIYLPFSSCSFFLSFILSILSSTVTNPPCSHFHTYIFFQLPNAPQHHNTPHTGTEEGPTYMGELVDPYSGLPAHKWSYIAPGTTDEGVRGIF